MNAPTATLLSIDPTRVFVDLSHDSSPEIRIRNAQSSSPWAVVEVQLPWNAQEAVVLRPHASAQPLTSSIEGLATFILLRDALRSRQPTLLRYSVGGRRVEHPLAVPLEAHAETSQPR